MDGRPIGRPIRPNLANLTGADADGFLAYEGIINFAREADGQIGNFTDANGYPESPLPGFPGTQTRDGGTGNASEEILTYLSFPGHRRGCGTHRWHRSSRPKFHQTATDGQRHRAYHQQDRIGYQSNLAVLWSLAFRVESPGLPGTAGGTDNAAAEILTYLEFPKAGYYSMGISCDDGFRLTPAEGPGVRIGALEVTAPAAIAGRYGAVSSGQENSGIAVPLPKDAPIVGKLVYATPPDASTDLSNAAQTQGNIALIDRSTAAVSDQVNRAQKAGAKAVVIVSGDDQPIVVIGQLVSLPVVMIGTTAGERLKGQLNAGVTVSLGEDPTLRLGEHNYINYTAGPDDFLFGIVAPKAGVYPFRCLWYARGGGNRANLEWDTVSASGQSILLNDSKNSQALKAYRERTAPPPTPTLGITRTAAGITITFTGVMQSADKVGGPYTDLATATSPLTVNPAQQAQFYRARQ